MLITAFVSVLGLLGLPLIVGLVSLKNGILSIKRLIANMDIASMFIGCISFFVFVFTYINNESKIYDVAFCLGMAFVIKFISFHIANFGLPLINRWKLKFSFQE